MRDIPTAIDFETGVDQSWSRRESGFRGIRESEVEAEDPRVSRL
jgi:hypothetical protein